MDSIFIDEVRIFFVVSGVFFDLCDELGVFYLWVCEYECEFVVDCDFVWGL